MTIMRKGKIKITTIKFSQFFSFINCIAFIFIILQFQTLRGQDYFTCESKIYKNELGTGLIKITEKKILNTPKWLYEITQKKNYLFANGFNGVNFTGLVIINLQSEEAKTIDLIKLGAQSNFISEILVAEHSIILNILGKYFSYDSTSNKLNTFHPEIFKKYSNLNIYIDNAVVYGYNNYSIINLESGENIDISPIPNAKMLYNDVDILAFTTREEIYIYNKKKNKYYNYPIDGKTVNLFNWMDFCVLYGDGKNIIFDGVNFIEAPPSFDKILSFNTEEKEILLKAPRRNIYKITNLEISPIESFKLSLINEIVEISPKFTPNCDMLIAAKINNEFISKFEHQKKIHLNSSINLASLQIVLLDNNWRLYTSALPIQNTVNYLNFDGILWTLTLMLMLANIIIVFTKRYLLFPILLFPMAIFILLIPIQRILNITILHFDQFIFYNILIIILSVGLFLLFTRISSIKLNELDIIHKFGHGNKGLNNLLRLYRITSYSNTGSSEQKYLLLQSTKKYFRYTRYELKEFLDVSSISFKNIFHVIVTDYYSSILNFFLLKLLKKKFKNLSSIQLNKINEIIFKIIRKIEFLRDRFYKDKSITSYEIKKILTSEIKTVHREISTEIRLNGDTRNILCNKQDLITLLDDLLSNAFRAVENTEIKIVKLNAFWAENFLIIEVINNGNQITIDENQDIFSPTFSTKKNGGFGLFNAKNTLRKYLGDITHSYNNGYTSFKIYLRVI